MDKQGSLDLLIKEISKYKGIIFDLDGTLVDLGADWKKLKEELSRICLEEKGEKIDFTPLHPKGFYVRNKFGNDFYSRLLEVISGFEMKEENYKPNEKLIDYINTSTENQKIAVYSMNTRKSVDFAIKKYLKRMPDVVISKDECTEPKPTEKDVLKILSDWKMNKEDVVYVGNSDNDLFSGQKAGIKTIIIQIF
jgi:phosphoglycolate phosphatase-like HAD superfamily hydrolase